MDGIADVGVGLEETIGLEETPLEETELGAESEGIQEETGETEHEGADGVAAGTEPIIKDGKPTASGKAFLDKLKAEEPRLAKMVTSALFAQDRFARAVPGGMKEIQTLRSALEPIGGVEGLQRVRTELDGFNQLDQQFTSADPKFLEALTDTPEGQEAFTKLAPAMIDKYRELYPEGFTAMVCSTVVRDMLNDRIPLQLERLEDFLGDNPKAAEVLNSIRAWVNKIGEWGKKSVAVPPRAADPAKGMEALNQREAELTGREWQGAAQQEAARIFNAEWEILAKGRTLTAVQSAAIKELYGSRALAALGAHPGFKDNAKRFFQSKDKAGYLRHMQSSYKQVLPRALKAAFDTIMPGKPGPRAATPAAKTAVPGTPAAKGGPSFIAKIPAKEQIDFGVTSSEMISKGQAVLLNGTRVQWRK